MKKWRLAAVPVAALVGGILSRFHGGGFKGGVSKILKAFLWALPFAACTGLAWALNPPTLFWGILWATVSIIALCVLLWTMVFKNTGHGGGMDVAHNPKEPGNGRDPEKLEYLILWLHGRMPRYWYDVLLLAVIGLFSTLGAAVAFFFVDPLSGIPVLLGGALGKPVGYMMGWWIIPDSAAGDDDFDEPTEIGEFLTGVFAYLGLAVSTLVALA